MVLHFLHLVLAALLVAAVMADLLFVRSPSSEAVAPRELITTWRKRLALTEMFLFLAVFGLGLTLWMPLIRAYPPAIFHTKFSLAVLFLILAKVRMLKERKGQVQIGLTRAMAALILTLLCLGAAGGLRG
jgi:hypothetical protein